jgi:hypothetical protein
VTFLLVVVYHSNKVSIHTPTQGVTFLLVVVYHSNKVSIHTPTQGVTPFSRSDIISQ